MLARGDLYLTVMQQENQSNQCCNSMLAPVTWGTIAPRARVTTSIAWRVAANPCELTLPSNRYLLRMLTGRSTSTTVGHALGMANPRSPGF